MKQKKNDGFVTITVPRIPGAKSNQQTIKVGHNFKNYIIKRGVPVRVPKGVALRIEQSIKAEQYASEQTERIVAENNIDN